MKDLKCKVDEFNNKLTKKDTVDREKDEIVTITAEYHNLNHFLSLIENENSSFKDRYSFQLFIMSYNERRPFAEIYQIQIIIIWRMNLKILLRKELKE
ncbi:hypothetical protein AB6G04_12795 [Proteus mirabilis]|uniref:hypothetical protein n=1 Tax=Proteus mirabilis TaxID=584 RepID=UPI0034DD2E48